MNFFKSKIIFLIAALTSILAQGQTLVVKESDSKDPIPGVALYNIKKDKSVVTDVDGKADLSLFLDNEVIYFQNFLYNKLQFTKQEIASKNYVIFMSKSVEGLNQVVVSASKFEQSRKDIPQTIISLSARDIEFANPQTSADALAATGNIFIQKSQLGGGSPIIRGFSTSRLLIAVDGVRMNNAIFRGGNLQNIISIDPFSINNTEVTPKSHNYLTKMSCF